MHHKGLHRLFNLFRCYFFDIKCNGKESKVHSNFVFSKMPKAFGVHVLFYLSKYRLRFYWSLASM